MLLTLKPPIQNGLKGPHEYSIIRQSIPTPRTSSSTAVGSSPPNTPPSQPSPAKVMDHSSRRGLPPPAAMNLPSEVQSITTAPIAQLPPPPAQWQSEDLRQWLQTKAEEDRRRQEEERTRQESLRLEQRRIEQSILRDAFQAGVPPHMVPLIFSGMGGGNSTRSSWEMAQQLEWSTPSPHRRTSSQQRQQSLPPLAPPPLPAPASESAQSLSSDVRRDSRAIPPNPYATHAIPPPAPVSSQPVPRSPSQPQHYSITSQSAIARQSESRLSSVSRFNTGEIRDMPILHPTANIGTAQYQPSVPTPSSSASAKSETAQSSIYFHHWVPPAQSQSITSSAKGQQETSSRTHHRSELHSPPGRKRKAHGPHQAPPPPSSHPGPSSPTTSHVSVRHNTPGRRQHSQGHSREQSDVSYESQYRDYSEYEQERRRSDQGSDRDQPQKHSQRPYHESSTGPAILNPEREDDKSRPRSVSTSPYDSRVAPHAGGYRSYRPPNEGGHQQ
ncbi:hypothetical protein BGW36DRAFT_382862 [Talaromyces proteolyticus]|uniref:Uncharacterized protein n=1 Tax=Talaromyces proteolyticus TaxID=1131652 RepID=A0AAD4PYU1_9EURO|nr:uncharacterized protein BGW36DRAFT_382862 [Talaromyces proteolyticus]KAH8695533.1 hypothetical protein BGW36DRAFT_382862 [Talaromyces proteolyticus]